MSQSSLQLLLHAGELQYIVDTIKASRSTQTFVGGCLFGLWRNSLKQPVIQFVTGSREGFDNIEQLGRSQHVKLCADIMEKSHCLLHLGFWFCAFEEDQAKQAFLKSKYKVLLCINLTGEKNNEQLTGEYIVKQDNKPQSSQLFKEDILPEHSSFRKFRELTSKIENVLRLQSPIFDGKPVRRNIERLVESLPSRMQVEAVTSGEQWYATPEGMEKLQLLFQYFQREGFTPEMSRDTSTQDMQFAVGRGYKVDFPHNFPNKLPIIRSPNGSKNSITLKSSASGDVCSDVVRGIADFIRQRENSSSYI